MGYNRAMSYRASARLTWPLTGTRLSWLTLLLALLTLALAALLAGCGDGRPTATASPTLAPTATPTPDPAAILRQAGAAMQALESTHFTINRAGGPAYLDEEGSLIFSSAEGDYTAPDAFQAEIIVAGPGIALEVNTVAIGAEQWITNPLNQQWEKLPPGWGFNPAILFDPVEGWQSLLEQDVSEIVLVGLVEQGEQSLYQIRATASGERIRTVTGGIASSSEAITVEIWVDPATSLVHRLHFVTGSPTGEPTEWTLSFSQFNQPITIAPPAA
jgi:hypothetical protein